MPSRKMALLLLTEGTFISTDRRPLPVCRMGRSTQPFHRLMFYRVKKRCVICMRKRIYSSACGESPVRTGDHYGKIFTGELTYQWVLPCPNFKGQYVTFRRLLIAIPFLRTFRIQRVVSRLAFSQFLYSKRGPSIFKRRYFIIRRVFFLFYLFFFCLCEVLHCGGANVVTIL